MILTTALAATAVSASRDASAQAAGADAQALVRFNRGRELFLAHNYEDALTEFRGALSLAGSPNTRLYIARCLRELGRNAEALTEFERAGAEASDRAASEPRYATTRDAARTEGAQVERRVGRLVVHVPHAPEDIAVTVGGHEMARAGWDVPTPLDPGDIEVSATAAGRLPFHERIPVTAGQQSEVTVELAVDPNAHVPTAQPAGADSETPANTASTSAATGASTESHGGGVRKAGIAVTVLGVLGAGAFVTFGLLAQNRFHALQDQCMPGPCDASFDTQIDEGQQWQLFANIGLGVGIVGLVAGVIMIAAGGPTETPHAAGATSRLRGPRGVTLWGGAVGTSGGLLGVRGAF